MQKVLLIMTVLTSLSMSLPLSLNPDSASARTAASAAATLQRVLAKPLILGASVSADHSSPSPGKKLALAHTSAHAIRTIAFGGRPSLQVLPHLKPEGLKDRSIVIAVDLFFWDSLLPSPQASVGALEDLLGRVKERGIPLVLGNIPNLMPALQPSRSALNQAMEKACRDYDKCMILPFDSFLQRLLREGSLTYENRRYSYRELLPDGLHVGPVGSAYLGQKIAELLTLTLDSAAG